jgi:hypothetical protein
MFNHAFYIHKAQIALVNLCIAFHLLLGTTSEATVSVASLKNNDLLVKEVITRMLLQQGYHLTDQALKIQHKPKLIICIVNTDRGKKFLKLHDHPEGDYEYQGGSLLNLYVPTIKAENVSCKDGLDLLIQPYIDEIAFEGRMLFDLIWLNDKNPNYFLKSLL